MANEDALIKRGAALQQARSLLAEHFDAGFLCVTWDEGEQTMRASTKFGNTYAIEGMAGRIGDLLSLDDNDEAQEDE